MGDNQGCSVGHVYPRSDQAWECARQLEKEKKMPMSVTGIEERGKTEYIVHDIIGCREGATYNHYVWGNERWARECAAALSRITGQAHTAQLLRKRFLFADVWRVLEGKLEGKAEPLPGIKCAGDLEMCCGSQGNSTCR